MKRLVATILAVLYLGSSTGATVHMHYCMNKLADWGLNHGEQKETCGNCGMEKSSKEDNGCCKDEHKFIKNDFDQKATQSSLQLIQVLATAPLTSYDAAPAMQLASVTEENPLSNAPPRSHKVAVYISKRTFLI
ncbi:MAG: HYC_CC_PP family protein [Agriterribacter sp.]